MTDKTRMILVVELPTTSIKENNDYINIPKNDLANAEVIFWTTKFKENIYSYL